MSDPLVARTNGRLHWAVDPSTGGRLVSFAVDGHELVSQLGEVSLPHESSAFAYGVFPMVPWAGRIARGQLVVDGVTYALDTDGLPHAMHGTTYDRTWDVTATSDTAVDLRVDLQPGWPFAGEATMQWRSVPEGLSLRLGVRAAESMPVWIGIHPWFRRVLDDGRVLSYAFDAKHMYVRGPDGIPTGELVPVPPGPWDDCFSGVSQAALQWGDLRMLVTASSDTWVVFDERSEAVCVEPQTAPPDAVRLGQAHWLSPGEEHSLNVLFDVRG
jgi:galactose mutarotase-like enzyme